MLKNRQKGFAILAAAIVIAVVGAGVVAIYYFSPEQKNKRANVNNIDFSQYQSGGSKYQYAHVKGSCMGLGAVAETKEGKIFMIDSKCTATGKENMFGYAFEDCEGVGIVIDGVCRENSTILDQEISIPEAPPCNQRIEKCFNGRGCDFIQDDDLKNACYGYLKKDPQYCDLIKNEGKTKKWNCYDYIIKNTDDFSLCREMLKRGRDIGIDCYGKYQESAEELWQCDEMKPVFGLMARDCYSNLAIRKKDAQLCRSSGQGGGCAYELARILNDASLCPISNNPEGCVDQLIDFNKGDVSICDKIIDIGEKEECLIEYAEKTGDADICEKLLKYRSSCYMNMAMGLGEASLCDKISIESDKKVCRNKMFYFTGDKALCPWTENPIVCANSKVTVKSGDNKKQIIISFQENGQSKVHTVELTPNSNKKIFEYMESEKSEYVQQ